MDEGPDTRLVKARLAAFEQAHRGYAEAQGKVDAAETQLTTAQEKLGVCEVGLNEELDGLARSLIFDGQERRNPFAAFGAPPASKMTKLPPADKVKVVRQLVAAVQRNKNASKATLQAACSLSIGMAACSTTPAGFSMACTASVRDARHTRDAIAQSWESTLAALKRGARAAADDGAPQLYTTLFGRTNHRNNKNGKATPAEPTPAPMPPEAAPTPPA